MEIKNGKIVDETISESEAIFREKLKGELKGSFGLQLEDIPEIIKKIGIRSQSYKVLNDYSYYSGISFIVKTKNAEYEIVTFRGNMLNPYAHIKVSHKGKDKYYSVKKLIQVERFE